MTVTEFVQKIIAEGSFIRWQEWLSTICQVASVWYARKNHIYVYPTGIVGVLLAAWVYFFVSDPPLYADGGLNIYYLAMSIYGWYIWTRKDNEAVSLYEISWCDRRELLIGLALFVIGWTILYFTLTTFTRSDMPILDSLVSSTAVTAMYWMAKRKIENWIAWIVSNIVAIPLNFYKGFYVFTIMYILFLALAWMGYQKWRHDILVQKS
jgi:nicotinamide mononucleotide transporter